MIFHIYTALSLNDHIHETHSLDSVSFFLLFIHSFVGWEHSLTKLPGADLKLGILLSHLLSTQGFKPVLLCLVPHVSGGNLQHTATAGCSCHCRLERFTTTTRDVSSLRAWSRSSGAAHLPSLLRPGSTTSTVKRKLKFLILMQFKLSTFLFSVAF